MRDLLVPMLMAVPLATSLLWAGVSFYMGVQGWQETRRELQIRRDTRLQDCRTSYDLPETRERCAELEEIQHVAALNLARASIGLVALAPVLAVLGWALLRWRCAATKAKSTPRARRPK
jgi:hypothetical protein